MSEKSIENKRQIRKKQTAEDFTPSWLVNQMLDKLSEYGPESFEAGKTWLDPACGDGGMLVPVALRLLEKGVTKDIIASTIYGTDIMQDNIEICINRLCEILGEDKRGILSQHIICTPLDKYKNGALDYHFDFEEHVPDETIFDKLKHK